jgi:GT2 family glycosyltransferase
MREGQNPARLGLAAYEPHKLGVAILSYIPSQEGYFSQSLEILKYQLASLRQNTLEGYDLTVFDNGSCPDVQSELKNLHAQGWIDWLVLSKYNLGKTGALNWLLAALPNQWVCYSDSDVLFRPGWFEKSSQILETFPRVGIVTAQPAFFDVLRQKGQAHLALLNRPGIGCLEYKPDARIVDEFCRSVGAPAKLTVEYHQKQLAMVKDRDSGTEAVIGATHMQFLARLETIRQVLPLPATKALAPEEDSQLDLRLDQAGYLHLSTPVPYVLHMGNVIDDRLRQTISELKPGLGDAEKPPKAGEAKLPPAYRGLTWLAGFRRPRGWMLRLYIVLFHVLAKR